jgi:hypothetical protein
MTQQQILETASATAPEKTTRDVIITGIAGLFTGAFVGAPVSIGCYLLWRKIGAKGASRWWAWALSGIVGAPLCLGMSAAMVGPQRGQSNAPTMSRPPSVNEPPVTMAKYGSIQQGMSYEQVVAVIGIAGTETASNQIQGVPGVMAGVQTVSYSWQNPNGTNMMAIFQNDKLTTKSQFGLK